MEWTKSHFFTCFTAFNVRPAFGLHSSFGLKTVQVFWNIVTHTQSLNTEQCCTFNAVAQCSGPQNLETEAQAVRLPNSDTPVSTFPWFIPKRKSVLLSHRTSARRKPSEGWLGDILRLFVEVFWPFGLKRKIFESCGSVQVPSHTRKFTSRVWLVQLGICHAAAAKWAAGKWKNRKQKARSAQTATRKLFILWFRSHGAQRSQNRGRGREGVEPKLNLVKISPWMSCWSLMPYWQKVKKTLWLRNGLHSVYICAQYFLSYSLDVEAKFHQLDVIQDHATVKHKRRLQHAVVDPSVVVLLKPPKGKH